jgi:hypothetical protein
MKILLVPSILLVLASSCQENADDINTPPTSMAVMGKHMILKGGNIHQHPTIEFDLSKVNGLVAEYRNDTVTGYQYYINGLKHGPYFHMYGQAFRNIENQKYPSDGFYKYGKKHGQFNIYHKHWRQVTEIVCFEEDDTLWKSMYGRRWKCFPYRYLVTPFKNDQTVEVRDPDGLPFYSGRFVNENPVGKHTVFRQDSSIIAKINYNNWTFSHYSREGLPIDTTILYNSYSVHLGR